MHAPWSLQSVKPHRPHTLVSLAICPFAQALSCSQWSHPLIQQRPWSQPLVLSSAPLISATTRQLWLHALPPTIPCHCFCSRIFSMVLVLCYHHWQTAYIQSVPLTPARHSPSPHLCVHPPLRSPVPRAFLQLHRPSSPTSIKDLGDLLSTNQVVIRAAKIRGLINKGLSLLAGGSQCLKRWHQSAFWEHQVDARTPGVPWNGKQRQALALANNAHTGCLLACYFPSLGAVQNIFFYYCPSPNSLAIQASRHFLEVHERGVLLFID